MDGNGIWGEAFGSWGQTASDGNAAKFDRDIGGFFGGIDRVVGGTWRLGLAAGYSYSKGSAAALSSSNDDSTAHIAGYAGNTMGPWRLRLGVANAWDDFSTERVAAFNGFTDRLSSGYSGRTTQIFGEMGFEVGEDNLQVEPYAGIAYVDLHTDSLREAGGDAALAAEATNKSITFSTLGVRSGNIFGLTGGMVSVHGVAAWQHALNAGNPTAALAFANAGASFIVAGVPIAKDSALIEIGAGLNLGEAVSISLDYSGRFGSGYSDNGIQAYASWKF